MATGTNPQGQLRSPTLQPDRQEIGDSARLESTDLGNPKTPSRRHASLKQRKTKRLRIADPLHRSQSGHNVYLRASASHLQLEHLLEAADAEVQTYDIEETRDGFFDASFHRPLLKSRTESIEKASLPLPGSSNHESKPLSLRRFFPQQLRAVKQSFYQVLTTRAGLSLLKSFLGVFVSYVICLIPASRDWLGRYNYVMVISAIVNHPARTIGSQLDGAVLTTIGTATGLGWGALALYVSTSTSIAQSGYGGVLATFLVIFAAVIGWLRCVFIRFYQAVIAAGFAICYVCLSNTSQKIGWMKLFDYGMPWVLGQAVGIVVSILCFPNAGSRFLAFALHDSLQTILEGLALPSSFSPSLRQRLAWQFVQVSQAVRDFTIDLSISRFSPDDVRLLRNLIQAVDRSVLSIRPETILFDVARPQSSTIRQAASAKSSLLFNLAGKSTVQLICTSLGDPTRLLIDAIIEAVTSADLVVLHIGGQSGLQDPSRLSMSLINLRKAMMKFDLADEVLVANPDLPSLYHKSADVAELFLFVHPVRQTADKVENLVAKVLEMQSTNTRWRFRPPSYPLHKAVMRTNAQVRHDRGGLTAGFYFRSKQQLDQMMADLQYTAYVPSPRNQTSDQHEDRDTILGEYQLEQEIASGREPNAPRMVKFRYRLWEVLHRLQGFESRFAFKVTLVTALLSVPAWLPQSRDWWNDHESWWAVVTVWAMMHPRVGGTFQDLFVRTFCAALGAVWGGLAYAAGNGNPYIMAVFATIYMISMLYRFTQSLHPRSGLIGCLSFTVISLSAYTQHGQASIITLAWTRGLAFVVGIIAALLVNWILWPFVARHELRKSLSAMMLHSAILYRGVIAKYIYHTPGREPGPEDITRSEMLEGRLREGFVRMRQLLELTSHEMRLRGPFNPSPYNALITACESFFEHLVQVRQSSLYFQPSMLASDPELIKSLTAPRRDAVAVILLNLYILASALKADQPVPKYLPSATAARRRLLERMEIVEREEEERRKKWKAESEIEREGEDESQVAHVGKGKGIEKVQEKEKGRRWADVYHHAFSAALTDIVEQVQELQRYTREICGEVEWGDEEFVGG